MAVNLTAVFQVRDRGSNKLRRIIQMMDSMNRVSRTTSESISEMGSSIANVAKKTSLLTTGISSLGAATGPAVAGIGALSASFTAAALGAAAFGAVAVSSLGDIFEASKEVEKIEEKLAKADSAKEKIAAQKELAALYADMSKAQQGALKDLQKFKEFWGGFTKKFEEPVFAAFSSGLQITQKILNGLEPTIKKVSGVVVELMQGFNKSIDGGGLKEFFDWLNIYAAKSLKNFLTITGNTFSGIFNLFKSFAPLGASVENGLVGMTQKFKQWSASLSGSKGFQSFIEYAKTNGSAILDILSNVWSVVVDVVKALAPLGTVLLNVFNKLSSVLAELTPWFGVLTDKVAEFASNILGKLGPAQEVIGGIVSKVKTLWSAFKNGGSNGLVSALFPPDIATKVNAVIDGIKTKISELMNAFKNGGFGGVFNEIFGEGSFETLKSKFEEVKSFITEKITQFAPIFEQLKTAFTTAWTTISDILSNAWLIIEPILSSLWNYIQIVGDVAMIVFNNVIAPAISFLAQLFSTLWSIAQPILTALSLGFEALSAVMKWMWDNILAPLVDFILTGVKNAFETFSGVLSTVQGWFETLSGWINTAYGYVKDFIGYIGKVKLPSWITKGVSSTVSFIGNAIGAGSGKGSSAKSNYHGLDNVPYDGYYARLHKGERVMTARENKEFSQGGDGGNGGFGDINITMNGVTIREEADIRKIADQLVSGILQKRGGSW
ncbi:phage tail protein [Lysinibacillus sp. TE18511]